MACSDALESAVFLRGLMVSMMLGYQVPEDLCGQHMEIRMVTDCKSLYDHIQREGTPKAPTEKRLALDLASVRQLLMTEAKHQWRRRFGGDCEPSPERPVRPPLHWAPTTEQSSQRGCAQTCFGTPLIRATWHCLSEYSVETTGHHCLEAPPRRKVWEVRFETCRCATRACHSHV